ncbi:hypothetical protein [Cryobacterium luteum]|uniref:Antitoxin VbhA domain-containing protein n=1 Tax=Cryobacterium luteum TaxID=1424661 RepID=A0A5F0D1T6_9MICO|nr:hypothetical protein [Cryobacterium luteum]TFB82343.1 hypothetical protein E3O10_17725 [Cryobacterium luteum]
MTTQNSSATPAGQPYADIERAMAVIEKGQQLAGHFPSAEALDSARRVLTGELSPEGAEIELNEALARIVDEERDAINGS